MKKKLLYIAYDGTQFDNEYDCLDYEKKEDAYHIKRWFDDFYIERDMSNQHENDRQSIQSFVQEYKEELIEMLRGL